MQELVKLDPESLVEQRGAKFRKIGGFTEGVSLNPRLKRNMKPREAPLESGSLPVAGIPEHVRHDLELSFSASSSSSSSSQAS
jgi:hypothetical protein